MDAKKRVVVVGAGPVGMMCALKLSQAGIPVTVLEKDESIPPVPKALTYSAVVLADLARAGILEDVAKICYANDESIWQWRKLDGTLLASMRWAAVTDEKNPRLYKPYSLQCGQHLLAKILPEHCSKFPTTQVLFGHSLDLEQNGDGVELTVAKTNGDIIKVNAGWVVGADGGKSKTRKLIGLLLDGFAWEEEIFVVCNVYYAWFWGSQLPYRWDELGDTRPAWARDGSLESCVRDKTRNDG